MQIKLKPGKPTEPGHYICKRKGSPNYEIARVWLGMFDSWSQTIPLDRLEDDALFSERIDLIVEDQ